MSLSPLDVTTSLLSNEPFVYLFLFETSPFFFFKKKLFSCLSFLLILDFILIDRYLVVCACCFLIILLIVFVFGRAGSWLLRRLSSRCSELWLLSI